jgi:hypothetical protein
MAPRTWAITLPHGTLTAGTGERIVELRIPTGHDEEAILDPGLTHAQRVTKLLERCIVRVGEAAPTPAVLGSLVAGDREALMLHLRRAAFGGELDCVLECTECGETMDLDLSIDELLVEPYPEPRAEHETQLDGGRRVRFRLPTGGDLEAAARAGEDPEAGVRALLERCVIDAGGTVEPLLDPPARAELARRMAALDPQADVTFAVTCPNCGEASTARLDAAAAILDELCSRTDELYGDVHSLALHYHWSEPQILALEVPRRRRYLALVADAGGGEWS